MGILIVRIITILLVAGLSGKGVYASDGRFDVLKAPKPLPKFSLMDQNSAALERHEPDLALFTSGRIGNGVGNVSFAKAQLMGGFGLDVL